MLKDCTLNLEKHSQNRAKSDDGSFDLRLNSALADQESSQQISTNTWLLSHGLLDPWHRHELGDLPDLDAGMPLSRRPMFSDGPILRP